MGLKNTDHSYGWVAKLFHWGMFLMIAGMMYVGFNLEDLKIYDVHKSFGLLILMLVVLRIIWKIKDPAPLMPKSVTNLQSKAAHAIHYLFYAIMIAFPVSGTVMSLASGHDVPFFGLFTIEKFAEKDKALAGIAHETHEILGLVIILLIALHVLAALYHHFKLKDNILTRMSPFKKGD